MQPLPVLEEISRIILVEVIPVFRRLFVILDSVFLGYRFCFLSCDRSRDRLLLVCRRWYVIPGILCEDLGFVRQESRAEGWVYRGDVVD